MDKSHPHAMPNALNMYIIASVYSIHVPDFHFTANLAPECGSAGIFIEKRCGSDAILDIRKRAISKILSPLLVFLMLSSN